MSTLATIAAIEFDPELRYRKPGESDDERLLRAVAELREELDTAAEENRTLDERAYEAERKLTDLRDTVRTFLMRIDMALDDDAYTDEDGDTFSANVERLVTEFEQELGP